MYGVFPIAVPQFGDAINVPGSHTKQYRKELFIPCTVRACSTQFGPDIGLYNFQDAGFFNGTAISILVSCPTGYNCPPGTYPKVFTYPRGTFVIPNSPPCNGFPIILTYTGCSSVISRSVPCGSSQAVINAAANSVIQIAAQQQAECDAVDELVNNKNPEFMNQAQSEVVGCEEGEVLTYSGNLPSYLSLNILTSAVVFQAGIVGGATQAEANAAAVSILHAFVVQAEADGKFSCNAGDCPDWTTLLWDVASVFTDHATGSFNPSSASQDNFDAAGQTEIFFEAQAVVGNTATIDYNGTGCNCNLHVEITSNDGGGAVVTVNSSADGEILFAVISGAVGSYDFPFAIPDTLSVLTTLTVTVSLAVTSDGVTSSGVAFTGTFESL